MVMVSIKCSQIPIHQNYTRIVKSQVPGLMGEGIMYIIDVEYTEFCIKKNLNQFLAHKQSDIIFIQNCTRHVFSVFLLLSSITYQLAVVLVNIDD